MIVNLNVLYKSLFFNSYLIIIYKSYKTLYNIDVIEKMQRKMKNMHYYNLYLK